jgi:hypothetical protein
MNSGNYIQAGRSCDGICVNLRDLRAICDGAMNAMTICVHLCDLWVLRCLRWLSASSAVSPNAMCDDPASSDKKTAG